MTSSSHPRVVAIIWTYNRFELAQQCVESVLDQNRPPDRVIVVDSASPDGSAERLRDAFAEIEVIELDENDGPGAAIAAALKTVDSQTVDYYWLVEDDSVASHNCLEMALTAARQVDDLGIVGPVGCTMIRGQWHANEPLPSGSQNQVDLVVLDGALVTSETIEAVGPPRTDYFIMMIDIEYPLRMVSHGFQMVQVGLPYQQLRLGSAASDSTWRYYYQTRNHLRMALDLRSSALMGGFVLRTAKHMGYALIHRDWAAIWLRLRGLTDGILGRMGRRIEPPQ